MNTAADEIDRILAPRTRWAMLVVFGGSAYILMHVAIWAAAGFPVLG